MILLDLGAEEVQYTKEFSNRYLHTPCQDPPHIITTNSSPLLITPAVEIIAPYDYDVVSVIVLPIAAATTASSSLPCGRLSRVPGRSVEDLFFHQ